MKRGGQLECCILISQKVVVKSVCNSQFPHKSVDLFFILGLIEDTLTDLNRNDFCKTAS